MKRKVAEERSQSGGKKGKEGEALEIFMTLSLCSGKAMAGISAVSYLIHAVFQQSVFSNRGHKSEKPNTL